MPTIVNNVETLASVPDILAMGGDAYWSRLAPSRRRTAARASTA
jgi:NADH:ubiquinone oxidoreductase subunit F (NADH-binding)